MKNIDYLSWLKEVDAAPLKEYPNLVARFFRLISGNNKGKFEKLDALQKKEEVILENKKLAAIQSMQPLYKNVRKAAKLEAEIGSDDLKEIELYEGELSGKIIVSPKSPADDLYHTVRLTLEKYINTGRLLKFKSYMSTKDNNYYFDSKHFPKYLAFWNFRDNLFNNLSEPVAEYRYLKIYIPILEWDKQDDYFITSMRKTIKAKLQQLLLYIETPETTDQPEVKSDLGIKNLFSLIESPPVINYEGENIAKRGSYKTRGKTQIYSLCRLFVEKSKTHMSYDPLNRLKLPQKRINEYLADKTNCDNPPKWTLSLPKRQADTLVKNARNSVGFSKNELFTEVSSDSVYVVMRSTA